MSARIHADHAATTRPAPEVVEAMQPWLAERFGNASSVHARGEAARDAIGSARLEVARLVGAQSEEIVFTATGSEANNLALRGALRATTGRNRLVTTTIEHASVLGPARALEAEGFALTLVPVRANGAVDPDELEAALGPDVALVSVMAVNNETGVIQPLEEIGPLVQECGALFHVDAMQAPGKIAIAVDGWQADLLSIAAPAPRTCPRSWAWAWRRAARARRWRAASPGAWRSLASGCSRACSRACRTRGSTAISTVAWARS